MSVLFGQAYYPRFDPKLWEARQPYPPLGTLYAAAGLRKAGFDVHLFDAMLADSESEWTEALDQVKPDVAILYEDNFNYLTKMCLLRMRDAALTMIGMAKQRGCTVLVCGSDASDHPEIYLNAGADYVLLGEGEATLGELMAHLQHAQAPLPHHIQSLAFFDVDQTLIQTPRRKVIRHLDDLPLPAWNLVDIPRYRAIWQDTHGYFALNMVSSRGCPFHCNWCAKPIWGQRYNTRSPAHVVAEMQYLVQQYKPGYLWFMDDMFGIKPGWTAELADHLEAAHLRIPFKCLNRADLLLREGEVEALARAGCDVVWMGVESGSQKILDAMDKGTKVKDIIAVTQKLKQHSIRVGYFLQFGYPGETRADIEMTFDLIRRCRPDEIGASVSYPLPGTKFYDMVKAQLGTKQNWVDSDDLAMMYKGPFTTEFYRMLHRILHREHRSQKSVDALGQVIRKPASLRKHHVRDAVALLYHQALLPLDRLKLNRLAALPHHGIDPLHGALSHEEAATPTPFQ